MELGECFDIRKEAKLGDTPVFSCSLNSTYEYRFRYHIGPLHELQKHLRERGEFDFQDPPKDLDHNAEIALQEALRNDHKPPLAYITAEQYAALCLKRKRDKKFRKTEATLREAVLLMPRLSNSSYRDVILCRDPLKDLPAGAILPGGTIPNDLADKICCQAKDEAHKDPWRRRFMSVKHDLTFLEPIFTADVMGPGYDEWLFLDERHRFLEMIEDRESEYSGPFRPKMFKISCPWAWSDQLLHPPEVPLIRNLRVNPWSVVTVSDGHFPNAGYSQLLTEFYTKEQLAGGLSVLEGSDDPNGQVSMADEASGAVSLTEGDA